MNRQQPQRPQEPDPAHAFASPHEMTDYPAFAAEKGRAALEATVGRLVTRDRLDRQWPSLNRRMLTREHFDGGF
jgi:hypothetical protein